jgi:hypothetical protein
MLRHCKALVAGDSAFGGPHDGRSAEEAESAEKRRIQYSETERRGNNDRCQPPTAAREASNISDRSVRAGISSGGRKRLKHPIFDEHRPVFVKGRGEGSDDDRALVCAEARADG